MKLLERLKEHFEQIPSTDLKYMSYSSEAVLRQSPVASRVLLWTVVAFVIIMLVWAGLTEIDEYTRGNGKVVPSSDLQVVQNLEGGILANLMVTEGEVVEKDQPLLQIDDTVFSSTFKERALQLEQLSVKAARLTAEAEQRSFLDDIEQFGDAYPETLLESEKRLYNVRKKEFESRLDSLKQKVTQKRQELSSVKINRNSIENSHRLLRQELQYTRPLVKQGAVSQVELLRLERQVNDLKGELDRAVIAIPQLEAELKEVSNNVESFVQSFNSEVRAELNEVVSELDRLKQGSEAFEDRVDRTIVRSPMKGTVKQLNLKTIGGVIQPGMDLVVIVPFDDTLLIDAKVSPADIAFIHPGQNATIKFTAYDFSIHGGLPASVVQISPDTIVDEEGNSFYEIRLQTTNNHLGKSDTPLVIIPGMTVTVDILTGKKSILSYLLKPILKTKELAFRER